MDQMIAALVGPEIPNSGAVTTALVSLIQGPGFKAAENPARARLVRAAVRTAAEKRRLPSGALDGLTTGVLTACRPRHTDLPCLN